MGPLADPTLATVRNRGAAEKKKGRVQATMETPRDRRQPEQASRQGQTEQQTEVEGDEDIDELMAAVAQALSEAERDAQTTQLDKTNTQDAEGNEGMPGEQQDTKINGPDFYRMIPYMLWLRS